MLVFALNYSEILKRNHEQARQAQSEFHEKLKLFTGVDLLETFVDQKRTGVERPGKQMTLILSVDEKRFHLPDIPLRSSRAAVRRD